MNTLAPKIFVVCARPSTVEHARLVEARTDEDQLDATGVQGGLGVVEVLDEMYVVSCQDAPDTFFGIRRDGGQDSGHKKSFSKRRTGA
jgi:hypothetical protein